MVAKTSRIRCRTGMSLVEIMVSIVILLAALIGTSNLRYYAALDAQKAAARIKAARIALVLCESWRGVGGDEAYDPAAHLGSNMAVTDSDGPDKPGDFTLLGSYKVVLDGVNYYATLSWKDVSSGLRALNIVVSWAQRDQGESSIDDTDVSFRLTTYTL
jgi:hypothetical protein